MDNPRNALTPGYKLHWYTIKKILGQGGFGITYLAEDTNLNQSVAIKEFLPIEMAVRDQSASVHPVSGEYGDQFKWGLDRFMSEAQTLAKFKHPNIVRVFTVFPENNTAYMVMEYEQGKGLHELLKNKATLSEIDVKKIILPILDGLKQVHAAGFIHRDIKPANIFIREDGNPVLLDFGSARQSFGEQTRTLTTMVSPGFAPFEQYVSKSDKQGPWTDIYGLGATMYRAVAGLSPAEAMDRSEGILHAEMDTFVGLSEINPKGYSASFLSAIDHALCFKAEDRPQSIADWLTEIEGDGYVNQEDVETVVATDSLNANNVNDIEKTEVLAKNEKHDAKKKPSFFRRVIKYGLIGFFVLFILGLLEDENKKNKTDAETPVISDNATDVLKPDASTDEIVSHLLKQAAEDIEALRLSLPVGNNAVEKYHQVVQLQPDNQAAFEGLQVVSDKYVSLAKNNIQTNKFEKARQYLVLGKEINPSNPDVPVVERLLAKAESAAKQKDTDKADNQPLISDEDKRQIRQYQKRLQDNARDKDARRKIQSIMKPYETKVKDAFDKGDFDTAEAYVKAAQEIMPNSVRLKALLKKIKKKRNQ